MNRRSNWRKSVSGDNAYIFQDATDITVTRGGGVAALTGLGTMGLDGTGGGEVSLLAAYTFGQSGGEHIHCRCHRAGDF